MEQLYSTWKTKMERFKKKWVEEGPNKIYTGFKYIRLMSSVMRLHDRAIHMVKFIIKMHRAEIESPETDVSSKSWELKKKGIWAFDIFEVNSKDKFFSSFRYLMTVHNTGYGYINFEHIDKTSMRSWVLHMDLIDILNCYRKGLQLICRIKCIIFIF